MNSAEVDALDAQLRDVDALLESLEPPDWERPTRCPPMRVREMVGHLGSVLHRFAEEAAEPRDDAVNCDRYRYWDPDPARAERVLRGSLEAAARPELLEWFGAASAAAVAAAREMPADKPCRRGDSVLPAVEFVATRVLEAGVHGMDVGHATLRGEVIHPLARRVVVDILQTRLGSALPVSIGWDDRTFILTGTGRKPLLANERWTLGTLADRFPLVS